MAIRASALLMVISSRVSSSSASAIAASYTSNASSTSPTRTLASADRRSSSAPVNTSDIPTLALSAVWLEAIEFLRALELDEALDFFLRRGAERFQLVEYGLRTAALFKEVTHAEVECLQDLQKCIQSDLVFALFHSRQIGLMNADALRELHLCQLSLTTKLPDFTSDEFELRWLIHRVFVDFYAVEK